MRGVAAGAAIAACAGVLAAQQFAPTTRQQIQRSSDFSYGARFVDLDGDGDLDVLGYPSATIGPIHVYENDGSGIYRVDARFQPVDVVPLAESVGLLVGDLDGDGRQDVVVGTVIVQNRGASGPIAVPHNLGEIPFALGDFNGDGRQDLVTSVASSGIGYQVSVWLASPNFSFTRIVLGIAPAQPVGGAAGDLDGDGLVDLVIATNGIELALRNTGGGNLVYVQSWLPAQLGDATFAIALHDFDRDGDLDLATHNGQSWVFRDNDGTGRLVATSRYILQGVTPLQPPFRLIDLDRDGAVDFVGPGQWWHNNLPAAFDLRALPGMPPGILRDVGDVDGDSDLDLLVVGTDGIGGAYRLGIDVGGRTYVNTTTTPWVSDGASQDVGAHATAVADLDRDGDVDLLCAGGSLHRNRGDGWFTPLPFLWGPYSSRVCLCDIDGDGAEDVLAVTSSGVRPLLNLGGGRFFDLGTALPFPALVPASVMTAAVAGDFDGNHTEDWVYATSSGDMRLERNSGGLTFLDDAGAFPVVREWITSLAACDFDRDGDLDVVAGSQPALGGPTVGLHLFVNDGQGHFANARLQLFFSPQLWAQSVQFFDADGDGDQDLVVGNYGSGAGGVFGNLRHRLLINDGVGHLIQGGSLPAVPSQGRVAAADVDCDGDLDLVADCLSGVLYWRNDGGLVFTNVGMIAPFARGEILLADLDGDSDPDLLIGNQLFRNRSRDATAPYLPLSGHAYALEFGGTSIPTGLAMPWLSTARAHVPLPPFGILGIDHTQAVSLPWLPISGGTSHYEVTLPGNGSLLGIELAIQAVLYDGVLPHLSPPLYETITH